MFCVVIIIIPNTINSNFFKKYMPAKLTLVEPLTGYTGYPFFEHDFVPSMNNFLFLILVNSSMEYFQCLILLLYLHKSSFNITAYRLFHLFVPQLL